MRRFDVESTYDTTVDTLWDLLQDASLLTKLTKFPKVRLVGDGASVEGNEVKLFVGVGPIELRGIVPLRFQEDRHSAIKGRDCRFRSSGSHTCIESSRVTEKRS